MIWTQNPHIKSVVLYQLSYRGVNFNADRETWTPTGITPTDPWNQRGYHYTISAKLMWSKGFEPSRRFLRQPLKLVWLPLHHDRIVQRTWVWQDLNLHTLYWALHPKCNVSTIPPQTLMGKSKVLDFESNVSAISPFARFWCPDRESNTEPPN